MWSTYVVSDPVQLVQRDVAWSVAAQPRSEAQITEGDAASNRSMDPQYLVTRLPGSSEPEFVLQRAFVPRSGQAGSTTARPELTGIMMARSDPAHYGELVLYQIDSGLVEAPDFVHSEIRKNDELTEFVKEKIGSVVLFGDMTLLLINDTIVYVRPVYVEAPSATAVPELSKVIAVNDDRIAMGNTLDEAIDAILDGTSATTPTPDDTETTDEPDSSVPNDEGLVSDYDTTGKSVVELIADAEEFLQRAEVAEAADLTAEAAQLREDSRVALLAAQGLLSGAPTSTPAPGQSTET